MHGATKDHQAKRCVWFQENNPPQKKTLRGFRSGTNYTILKQICEYVPGNLVNSIAKKYGVDKVSRSFKPWNHVVAMLYAQISHAIA